MPTNDPDLLAAWRPNAPLTEGEVELLDSEQGRRLTEGLRTEAHGRQRYLAQGGTELGRATRKRILAQLFQVGQAALDAGAYSLALAAFSVALRLRLGVDIDASEEVLALRHELAVALGHMEQSEAALRHIDEVIVVRLHAIGPTDIRTMRSNHVRLASLIHLGRAEEAIPLAHEALRICREELGPSDPDTLEVWNALATALVGGGFADQAVTELEDALRVCGERWGSDHDSSLMLSHSLGEALYERGDIERALQLEEHVVRVREVRLGPDHPLTIRSTNNYALSLRRAGSTEEAERILADIDERLRRSPDISTRAAVKARHAGARGEPLRTRPPRVALAVYEELRKSRGEQHPDTLMASLDAADVLADNGNWAGATSLLERAVGNLEQLHGLDHPSTQIAASRLLALTSSRHHFDVTRALSLRLLASIRQVRQTRREVFDLAKECVETWIDEVLLKDSARLSAAPPPSFDELLALLPEVSRTLIALRDGSSMAALKDTGEGFSMFHAWWTSLCIRFATNDVLVALAPLHGVQTWTLALDVVDGPSAGPTQRNPEFADVRRELALLRDRLAYLRARIGSSPSTPPWELSGESATGEVQRLARVEDVLLNRYRALSAGDRDDRGSPTTPIPWSDLTIQNLVRRLTPDEGLVVIYMPADEATAIVVTQEGLDYRNLPGLQKVNSRVQSMFAAVAHGGGLTRRIVGMDAPRPDAESVTAWFEDWELLVSVAFWTPLNLAYGHVARWHVVSGPSTHGYPLSAAPNFGAARYYCGLPAYLRLRDVAPPHAAPARRVFVIDPGAGGAPIPFVEAEMRLAERLDAGTVLRAGQLEDLAANGTPTAWHVACHGQIVGSGEHRHGSLLAAPLNGTQLDAVTLAALASRENVTEVFLSACLGGLVGASETGDAAGLVAALQASGVLTVIACVAPVSDFYMPLLAAAYVFARQTAAPAEALRAAKSMLRTGDWPRRLMDAVSESYRDQTIDIFERIGVLSAADPEACHALVNTVAGWLLPDDFRDQWFGAEAITRDNALKLARSEHCTDPARRRYLAIRIATRLVGERSSWPVQAYQPIEHLCACTVCYG